MGGRSYVKKAWADKQPGHKNAGRKPWVPTEQDKQLIMRMGARGISIDDIAKVLEKDFETVKKHCSDLIELSRIQAHSHVAGCMLKRTETSQRAAEYFLSNRYPSRWRPMHQIEVNTNVTVAQRPDLSGLSAEDLAILSQAAAIMGRVEQPRQIEGEFRRTTAAAQQEPDDEE